MTTRTTGLVWGCLFILAASAVPGVEQTPPLASAVSTNGLGPKIQFATNVYDYGQVFAGEPVKATFAFTNTGDRLLEVTAVQPTCHCTVAGDWSHQVEPGKTGTIAIEFHSDGYAGQVERIVTVVCNDPGQTMAQLHLRGTVKRPVDVNPLFAVLNVLAAAPSNATTTLHIVNNLEEPLALSAPESNNRAFAAELQTNQPGKDFQLVVKAVPPLAPGTAQGQITLKTSSTRMPLITVTAIAYVQAAVAATPPQIYLPAPASSNKLPVTVVIQNNVSQPLALSEPAVNVPGVEVELKELQPGRQFAVVLTFPEGFQIPPGQKAELSVKSNHPQFPAIKIPITQPAAPVIIPGPARATLPAAPTPPRATPPAPATPPPATPPVPPTPPPPPPVPVVR